MAYHDTLRHREGCKNIDMAYYADLWPASLLRKSLLKLMRRLGRLGGDQEQPSPVVLQAPVFCRFLSSACKNISCTDIHINTSSEFTMFVRVRMICVWIRRRDSRSVDAVPLRFNDFVETCESADNVFQMRYANKCDCYS